MSAHYKGYTIKVHYNRYQILDSNGLQVWEDQRTIFNALNIIDQLARTEA